VGCGGGLQGIYNFKGTTHINILHSKILLSRLNVFLLTIKKILGTDSLASITPVVFNTTENVIERFTPLERGCYINEEFRLKILNMEDGFRYSIKNCLYSSAIEKILQNCSCTPNVALTIPKHLQLLPCR
jgi:hypothetical protein